MPGSFTLCGGGQVGQSHGQISWYAYGTSGWTAKVQSWTCSLWPVRSDNDLTFNGTQSGLSGTVTNPCPGSFPYLTGVWVNAAYNGGVWFTAIVQSFGSGLQCSNGTCQPKPTYSVTLSSDVFGVSAGSGAILTATTDRPVDDVGGTIRLLDVTANTGQINCASSGTLCRAEVYVPSGVPHTFRAEVFDAGGQLMATSNDVSIGRAPWSVSLSYDMPGNRVVATANQNPGATNGAYRLEIFNADTGAIQLSCATNPCYLNVSAPATRYIAQVAPPASSLATSSDVQARSGVVLAPTDGPTGDDARCQCPVADPIDVASGQLHETTTDLSMAGRNGGLAVTRAYLSGDADEQGQFGYGWQPSYGAWLGVVSPGGYGRPAAMADGSTPPAPSPVTAIDAAPPHTQMNNYPAGETVQPAPVSVLSNDPTDIPADAQSARQGLAAGAVLAADIVSIDIHLPGVGTVSFQPVASGSDSYAPVGGHLPDTLVHNTDGSWTLTQGHRRIDTFNGLGWLLTQCDLNGNTVTLTYDSHARLSTVTDDAGRSLTYTYNSAGYVGVVTDSSGRSVSYGYGSAGNLTSVTDPAGKVTGYGYSGHLLTTVTDPRGHTATNTYDTLGHVTQQVDRAGRTTQLAYTFGNPETVTITEPNGSTTTQQYTDGELTSLTRAAGTPDARTWTYTYDPVSLHPTSVTDSLNHVWTATYDSDGNMLTRTDPLNHTTTMTYDGLDDLLTVTDPSGTVTTNTYDTRGNLETTSTPLTGTNDTATTTYTYGDPAHPDDVTAVTDPRGKTTTFTYDSYGQLTATTDPTGDQTTYSYTCTPAGPGCRSNVGWVYSTVSPRGNATGATPADYTTSYTRNDDGQTLTATDPLGHATSYSYDDNGNLSTVTDANNHTTSYAYTNDDEPKTVTRPDTTTLQTGYDTAGNVTSQTDGAGNVTSYTYSPLNQVASATTPPTATNANGITTTYTYDAAGRLATTVNAANQTTSYGYDAANRLTSISHSDGTTPDVTYGYDANDRRTSMTDGTGTSSYSYDSLGRLTDTTNGGDSTVGYGYDLNGNVTSLTYPNNQTVTRSYDDSSRLTSVTDWNSNTSSFSYDRDGNLTGITYPNGVTESTTLNHADQSTAVTDSLAATTLASYNYSRDPLGLLASTTPTGATGQTNETYGHSTLDQLTSYTATTGSGNYSYDNADNLTGLPDGTTQTFDSADELTGLSGGPAGTVTYGYSSRGDRTSLTNTGGVTNFGYDQADRLTSFTPATGGSASYSYDGDGLRASKTIGTTSTSYTWDRASSGLPLLLSDGTSSYLYGPDGAPIEQIDASGTPTYVQHDAQKSTRVLTNSTGTVVATYTYDPYGNTTSHTGTATSPLRYGGQYQDDESRLYYLRARYYDPSSGTFATRDPMEAITGQPYQYASDDPIDNSDPTGLCNKNPLSGSFWTEGNCLSEHVVIGASICLPPAFVCGGASYQDGHVQLHLGPIGVGRGPYVGWANKTPDCRQDYSVGGGVGGPYGGPGFFEGVKPDGSPDTSDWEFDWSGPGVYAGPQWTWDFSL